MSPYEQQSENLALLLLPDGDLSLFSPLNINASYSEHVYSIFPTS